MAAVSHGVRHLRQGIGNAVGPARSIHISARPPSTAQRLLAETRSFLGRLVSHLATPGLSESTAAAQPALARPQPITSRLSLPVKHALSRPFSAPHLPRPPVVPANVTHVGLGTARAFHSGRPIFQNMVDNVPIATRALWEAEWDLKVKKKEARRMRRASQDKSVLKSREMLKPRPKLIIAESRCDTSDLDVYFPVQPTPPVITHLLVPLAPTPTMRLPLSARTDGGDAHPLLPIADLASTHTRHRLHSLRVSTLFARLDAANVRDDPGVNVDAYAFGPRHDAQDPREKQCTILRVTFRGWHATRVRSILGDSAEEWYSLQETHLNGRPTLDSLPDEAQDVQVHTHSGPPSHGSAKIDSGALSEAGMDGGCDALPPPPLRAYASAEHDLVFPTLDFSSTFSDTVDCPPQPPIIFCTGSELARDAELASRSSALSDLDTSWECLRFNTLSPICRGPSL